MLMARQSLCFSRLLDYITTCSVLVEYETLVSFLGFSWWMIHWTGQGTHIKTGQRKRLWRDWWTERKWLTETLVFVLSTIISCHFMYYCSKIFFMICQLFESHLHHNTVYEFLLRSLCYTDNFYVKKLNLPSKKNETSYMLIS